MLPFPTTLFSFVLFSTGCKNEPVLRAIEQPALLKEVPSAEERLEAKEEVQYSTKEGVYVDVMYLGGRDWIISQPILLEQLGSLQETQELPMRQGIRYQYDNGSIFVYEGRIYRMDLMLPELLRRSSVLQILGFPEQVDKYLITHREYILENEWAFRRIRMKRDSKSNEFVKEVSAWKFSPQEL
jgi:hypothetical protein